jgi:hypothetical protein
MPRRVVDLFACWRGLFGSLEYSCEEDGAFMPFVAFLEEKK